jgi:hypothetical protein
MLHKIRCVLKFQVFMVVTVQTVVFWAVILCSLVGGYILLCSKINMYEVFQ